MSSLEGGRVHLLDQRVVSFVVGAAAGGSVAVSLAGAKTERAFRARERRLTEKEELLTEVERLTREAAEFRAQAERERETKERLTAELSEARARIDEFGRLEADLRQRLGRVSGLQPDRPADYQP
jgi:predicted RNase H-like nuclease (RuvC/YqgF family)